MAPQKGAQGVKRAASRPAKEDQPSAKVLKEQKEQLRAAEELEGKLKQHGVTKGRYTTIIAAIDNQKELSDDCRQMLKNSVLTSLCVLKDERHEIQTRLVEMIGKAIGDAMGKFKDAAEKERSVMAEVERAHKVLTDAAESAGRALAEGVAHTESQQAAFGEAQQATAAAETALAETQDEQRKGADFIEEKTKERETVAAAISTDFAAILNSSEAGGEPDRKHVDSLVALATKLGLEDSLLEAMPGVLQKRSENRNSFDQMVLDQLNECLRKCAQDVEGVLAAADPATKERAAAVARAEAALEAAKGAQAQAAEALRASETTRDSLQAAKDAADEEVKKHLPKQKRSAKELEKKQWDVESFGCTVNIYEELRDRTSKVATVAPETSAEAAEVAAAGA